MNVYDMNTKQMIIQRKSGGDKAELGVTVHNKRLQNEVNDFPEPKMDAVDVNRKIQNMNMLTEVHTFEAVIDDDLVNSSDVYGDSMETKEQVEQWMDMLFKSAAHLELEYGHINVEGYMTELSFEERAQDDNSTYRIELNFLVGRPMSGGS